MDMYFCPKKFYIYIVLNWIVLAGEIAEEKECVQFVFDPPNYTEPFEMTDGACFPQDVFVPFSIFKQISNLQIISSLKKTCCKFMHFHFFFFF